MTEKPVVGSEPEDGDLAAHKLAIRQLVQQVSLREQRLQHMLAEREKLLVEDSSRQHLIHVLQLELANRDRALASKDQAIQYLNHVVDENKQLMKNQADLTADRDRLAVNVGQLSSEKALLTHEVSRLSRDQQQKAELQLAIEAQNRDLTLWQERAFNAESAYTALRNTRSLQVVKGWWRAKAFVGSAAAHPVQRSKQLLHQSAHILSTEGSAVFAHRLGRWLRGERRYYGVTPTIEDVTIPEPPADDSGQLHALRSQPTRQIVAPIPPVVTQTGDAAQAYAALGHARLATLLATNQRIVFPRYSTPVVSIVIPVHNQVQFTYLVLENLLATTQGHAVEVIVVDDASIDETPQFLAQVDNIVVHRNAQNEGFGETCNHGAALAKGTYVCFINNDTLPMPGWLDALLAVIESKPECGAVGAKIIFPDMRLQEAGSIAWQDGSALGYGRGEDPFLPEFGYSREVDFCSAACLLVRTELFRTIGGFDRRYAPAYYEDVDLCFAIREAGYSVFFVADAVIVHLEHATSGRESAVALQLKNRERFVERWEEQLTCQFHPTALTILRGRDRRPGKRVLVLDDIVPITQLGSGFPRTLALLSSLSEAGYIVTYLPTTDPRPYEPMTTTLQDLGVEVLYGVMDIPARLQERTGLYDIVIVSRPHNAPLINVARAANPKAFIIYDAEALFTLRESLQAEIEQRPFTPEVIAAKIQAELAPMATADLLLTVSDMERRTILQFFPNLRAEVWGHAIEAKIQHTSFAARKGLCFVGYLASEPNNDALLYFFTEIYPLILEKENDCTVTIVGVGATPELLALTAQFGTRVYYAGFVDDLSPIFDASRVFIAAHRFAAGVPLKVIEAMARGIPCVISQLLGTQLNLVDDREALIAASPVEFSTKIIALLRDETHWRRIQASALSFVTSHYGFSQMKEKLINILEREEMKADEHRSELSVPSDSRGDRNA